MSCSSGGAARGFSPGEADEKPDGAASQEPTVCIPGGVCKAGETCPYDGPYQCTCEETDGGTHAWTCEH